MLLFKLHHFSLLEALMYLFFRSTCNSIFTPNKCLWSQHQSCSAGMHVESEWNSKAVSVQQTEDCVHSLLIQRERENALTLTSKYTSGISNKFLVRMPASQPCRLPGYSITLSPPSFLTSAQLSVSIPWPLSMLSVYWAVWGFPH